MKRYIFLLVSIIYILCCSNTFAQTPLSFGFTFDLAYYPLSSPQPDPSGDIHFAAITDIYAAAEARLIGKAHYTIPLTIADNPFFASSNLTFSGNIEITPITLEGIVSLSFTPVAFLTFSTGSKIGSGWDIAGLQGIAVYNQSKKHYDTVSPFSAAHTVVWAESVFQFDLAAVLPGDWNHVVFLASYKSQYEHLTAATNGQPWIWQTIGQKANALSYESSIILGYKMPLPLEMIAIQVFLWGYYNNDSFDMQYKAWNPTFMTIEINPTFVFSLSKRQSLLVQCSFSSRRSFAENITHNTMQQLEASQTGREWFFRRLALSYSYTL